MHSRNKYKFIVQIRFDIIHEIDHICWLFHSKPVTYDQSRFLTAHARKLLFCFLFELVYVMILISINVIKNNHKVVVSFSSR